MAFKSKILAKFVLARAAVFLPVISFAAVAGVGVSFMESLIVPCSVEIGACSNVCVKRAELAMSDWPGGFVGVETTGEHTAFNYVGCAPFYVRSQEDIKALSATNLATGRGCIRRRKTGRTRSES